MACCGACARGDGCEGGCDSAPSRASARPSRLPPAVAASRALTGSVPPPARDEVEPSRDEAPDARASARPSYSPRPSERPSSRPSARPSLPPAVAASRVLTGSRESGALAADHPLLRRDRAPSYTAEPYGRASGDLYDDYFGPDAARMRETSPGLFGDAGTSGGGARSSTDPIVRASMASAQGDDNAFLAALENVPNPADRRALTEAHLRARGASDEAIRAGVQSVVNGGLRALDTWMRNDLARDLERIRAGSETERERIRQQAETERMEIAAETERYRIDHARRDPAPAPASGGGLTTLVLGVAVAGLAALVLPKLLTDEKSR